jgi:hypothetical protein
VSSGEWGVSIVYAAPFWLRLAYATPVIVKRLRMETPRRDERRGACAGRDGRRAHAAGSCEAGLRGRQRDHLRRRTRRGRRGGPPVQDRHRASGPVTDCVPIYNIATSWYSNRPHVSLIVTILHGLATPAGCHSLPHHGPSTSALMSEPALLPSAGTVPCAASAAAAAVDGGSSPRRCSVTVVCWPPQRVTPRSCCCCCCWPPPPRASSLPASTCRAVSTLNIS